MVGQMYFGNRNRMTWVKCPDTGMGMTRARWTTDGVYLNGGGYVRESTASHIVYEMGWNFLNRAQLYAITDYRDGVYGPGNIYFLDPFQMDRNVLPQNWALPALEDGQPLTDERPVITTLSSPLVALNAPLQSATYTLTADTVFEAVWVPVPDGYTFHVGGLYSSTGTANIVATPDAGAAVPLTPDMNAATHVIPATAITSAGGGVTLSLTGVGTITLVGLMAQVLPNGRVPTANTFMSGQGTSGSKFVGDPSINGYSAVRDHLALSVRLKETGAWDE